MKNEKSLEQLFEATHLSSEELAEVKGGALLASGDLARISALYDTSAVAARGDARRIDLATIAPVDLTAFFDQRWAAPAGSSDA